MVFAKARKLPSRSHSSPSGKGALFAKNDPRPSLEEFYDDHAGYVKKVDAAAAALVRQHLLLQEDAERYIEQARRNDPFKS